MSSIFGVTCQSATSEDVYPSGFELRIPLISTATVQKTSIVMIWSPIVEHRADFMDLISLSQPPWCDAPGGLNLNDGWLMAPGGKDRAFFHTYLKCVTLIWYDLIWFGSVGDESWDLEEPLKKWICVHQVEQVHTALFVRHLNPLFLWLRQILLRFRAAIHSSGVKGQL